MSERTDTRRVKREKKTGRGWRPHVAAVGAVSGWEPGRSSMGTMRQEAWAREYEGRGDWKDRSHLISEIHLWVTRAWVLLGSGLHGAGNTLAKDILGNTCSQV